MTHRSDDPVNPLKPTRPKKVKEINSEFQVPPFRRY
jgi:hypothetical protein